MMRAKFASAHLREEKLCIICTNRVLKMHILEVSGGGNEDWGTYQSFEIL